MGGDTVPATKAHMNATNRYMAKAYDSLRIIVPKGRKAEIEAREAEKAATRQEREEKRKAIARARDARRRQIQAEQKHLNHAHLPGTVRAAETEQFKKKHGRGRQNQNHTDYRKACRRTEHVPSPFPLSIF